MLDDHSQGSLGLNVPPRRWKVAIYTHSLPPEIDGVSRRFTGILNEMKRQGHTTIAFTLEKDVQEVEGCKFYHLDHCYVALYPVKRLGAPYLKNFWVIYNALKRERPDVVHCVSDATTVLFCLAGRLLGIPVVVSIHTDVVTLMKSIGFKSMASFTCYKDRCECALADGVATTSPSFMQSLHERGIQATHVIKTAVDMNVFQPAKFSLELREKYTFGHPDATLAVFVGRLSPEKGLTELMDWVTAVPNTYLAIVGDGPFGEECSKMHGEENRIYCRPQFIRGPQVAQVMASADVHVSASQFETLGNTVLEAHACGTPVVMPRAAGFVDTVTTGQDGFLYDPNVEGDATAKLRELVSNPERQGQFGEAGRRKVRSNTIDCVVSDLLKWYEQAERRRDSKSAPRRVAGAIKAVLLVFVVVSVCSLYFFFEACYISLRGKKAMGEGAAKGAAEKKPRNQMPPNTSVDSFLRYDGVQTKEETTPLTEYVFLC